MKTYKLENLTCAHCADTIEQTLKAQDGVRAVRLQFATLDLHLDADDLEAVRQTIEKIEPGVKVVDPQASVETDEAAATPWWPLAVATAVLAALLGAEAAGWVSGWLALGAFGVLYVAAGWPVLLAMVRNLRNGQVFDENFLMGAATLAAWVVGAGAEAASVMVFYQWGEYLQDRAVERSRRSLGALLAARPRVVRTVTDNGIVEVSPESASTGTVFEVRAGEQIPLDGEVLSGQSTVDTAALTGESLPRAVEPGSEVSAGFLNQDGVLRLRALRPFGESAWAGVVASVDAALANKAPLDKFITRFARVYTPAVLALALVLFAALTASGIPWHDSLYRSLVLLVISCPCALVVSIPLTYLGAIGAASRKGLLVRDAGALDRLARVTSAAFDKTGTLTEGRPRLQALVPVADEGALRGCLSAGFAASSHPLARAWDAPSSEALEVVETKGQGVAFIWKGERAAIGRRSFLRDLGFTGVPAGEDSVTSVHAADGSGYLGRADFADPAKADTPAALDDLRRLGLGPLALLSGDTPAVVQAWGRTWGVEARGGLLPDEKLKFVAEWEDQGRRTLFVGDGLNDAPVLARASVGVSLGAGASAAAIETADVAILDPSPRQVPRLVRLGRRTKTLLYQNIVLALGLKALFMVLGGLGLAGLWEAVFADVGVALLAVANSLRAGRSLD